MNMTVQRLLLTLTRTLTLALALTLTLPVCGSENLALSMNARPKKQKVADVSVVNLTTERLTNPLSLDTPTPRLGWQIVSTKNDVMQTSAQVIVASSREKAENLEGDLWTTTINGDQSQWIEYKGKELRSNTRCYWRVKVCTTQGDSEWSDINEWNVALLNEADWKGRWIGLDQPNEWDVENEHSRLSSRYYRQEFKLESNVKRAMLYICGLGMYEAFINGKKVSDDVLTPAPTDYTKTVLYNAYDVTSMLQEQNAIGVVLGNGRYYTMQQKKKPYKIANFGYPTLRANLIIEYENGKKATVSTDEKWRFNCDGPIRSNNEYDGEIYDARKEFGDWAMPGYDDSKWTNPERTAIPRGTLRGMMTPAMRELQTLPAKDPLRLPHRGEGDKTRYIVDFGQNMSGWVHIRINGAAKGDTISIRYAERLDSTGNLWTANLRHAQSTDYYIANGNENGKEWHPTFSYHGGRYVEVSGLDNLAKDDIWACQVSDNIQQTGTFECSDTILTKVMHNALWGILTNYKGMPIDCPQRDERQPWLGDRTAGCLGESYFFDVNTLYAKWTRDIVEAQREDGCIPGVAPAFWNYYNDDVTWPAALPMALEMLYDQYGDDKPVRKFYPAVKKWLEHIRYQYGKGGLITKDKYGDWCMPPEKPELIHSEDPARQTDGTLISTAYFYRMCNWMKRFAKLQGISGDEEQFDKWGKETKAAFNKKFLTVNKGTNLTDGNHWLYPDSTFYGNNTVTANLLPLAFGMIDDKDVELEVKKNIIENIIVKNGGHVSTGVIGGSWIMRALSDMGRGDVAWLLATQKSYPSWGYMAEQGATTTWELWNGDTANPAMNSGNHVMLLGDLVTWAFQNLGGIQPLSDEPGYKRFRLSPDYGVDEINHINASYNTIYGKVVSRWEKKAGKLVWHVEIPANTKALVDLPDGKGGVKVKELGSGSYDLTSPAPSTRRGEGSLQAPSTQGSPLVGELEGGVVVNEFLYENATFPECHSASIAELPNGDLVATYFGGTKERNPDCCIWVSRKAKGAKEWSKPILAAHGKMPFEEMGLTREEILKEKLNGEITLRDSRKAAWNPVIFYNKANKQLEIYFKLGINPRDWSGWIVRSKDGGKTWSKREKLGKFSNASELKDVEDLRVLGPVKNKIYEVIPRPLPTSPQGRGLSPKSSATMSPPPVGELEGVRLIAPTSLELNGWRLYFEISDDGGKTWRRTADVDAPLTPAPAAEAGKKVNAIQPAILKLDDGRLAAVARTRSEHVAITYSSDNGETWSKLELLDVPNNNSGLDAVTLQKPFDGGYKHVMICNDAPVPQGIKSGKGHRTPLSLLRSKDGRNWEHWMTLEDSPISQYSYPSIIQTSDGNIHCIYTWRRQRIKHVEIKTQ